MLDLTLRVQGTSETKTQGKEKEMNTPAKTTAKGQFRPQFALYHPNARGTGSAVKMDVHPALDDREGFIMLTLANQATVADRSSAVKKYATFDWAKSLAVKLGFADLCALLQVFRGECEAVEEGRGLFHVSSAGTTKIGLKHMIDPHAGYLLDIYRTGTDGAESAARFFFGTGEALGLSEAVCGVMSAICFGVPAPSWENARSSSAAGGAGNEAA